MWLLTNKNLNKRVGFELIRSKNFCFLTDQSLITTGGNNSKWLIDGYILPRLSVINEVELKSNSEILNSLVSKYEDDFINHVKGIFTIICINDTGFKLISDHLGIKKFFIYNRNSKFIISNDLQAITSIVEVSPSFDHMAVYALTYHFIDGLTIFNEIRYNDSAEIINYRNKRLYFSKHWNPQELLQIHKGIISPEELANHLVGNIKSCLSFLKSQSVSLSLTGGVDSRLLFSILIDQDIRLHTYTYGNPESFDCALSKIIADDFNVPHSIYDIRFTKETFKIAADHSIRSGQSLCSLHRAHRLKAIELEASFGEAMFLGTMGGEFIKIPSPDDYILSNFVYEFSRNHNDDLLIKYLKRKAINISRINIEKLMDFFMKQNWCKNPELVDFYGLIEIAARLHHAQNDIHYSNYFKYIFTPYIDIDYLIALFQTKYYFLQKKKYHTSFSRRLNNLSFASEIQSILNKQLTEYLYSSGFLINEYRFNKVYAAIRSRIRKKVRENIPNFPLSDFIKDFSIESLQNIKGDESVVNDVFDIDYLLNILNTNKIDATESSWLKFTTPVQMDLTMRYFS
ncbi:MAG: hypothetical protein GX180_14480 [Enterococcus sp.]|nr:hypothetical protein [Enterococcus sp.]